MHDTLASLIKARPPTPPALFHATHAKAGSTWICNILSNVFPGRVFARFGGKVERYRWNRGDVYPAIFLDYEQFLSIERDADSKIFFVIRDPRDTLVSLYFSMRYTHTSRGFPHVSKFREETEGMSDAEGILYTFKTRRNGIARMQKSWLDSDELIVKYEDLIAPTGITLSDVLRELDYSFDEKAMEAAIAKHSFENAFGRKMGERDNSSHGRQGLPGDWRNYSSPN